MKHILVVDDEPQIAGIVRDYLERAGYRVTVAGDGADAVAKVTAERPNLVILDLALPRLGGLDVTRIIRKDSSVPIIMLTARVDEADRVVGLELGADDYVTKPFSPRELVARVRAVLRRMDEPAQRGEVVRAADVTLDRRRMTATAGSRAVALTATEFELVATLAGHPGRVFTRTELLDAIRGIEIESYDRAIDAHVKNVRRKLEPDPQHPRYLLTVYGVGYKFSES